MSTDQFIRKQAGPDPRAVNPKPNDKTTAENKGKQQSLTSWTTGKKGDASSASRASPTSPVTNKSANDFQGHQQKNMELRGSCFYVQPQGGSSPIPPGGNSPINGYTDAASSNIFEIEISEDMTLNFDWSGFDNFEGSKRGNIEVNRCIYMTLIVTHKGFTLTLPSDIRWHEGEAPDLTPQGPVNNQPATSEHVINLFAIRKGVGEDAVTRIYGGLWGSNMRTV